MKQGKSQSDLDRERLMGEIIAEFRDTAAYTGRSRPAASTLRAMREVDRREFIDAQSSRRAYINSPLGIGYGQTISRPFIVALMTDLIDPGPESRILEIGTGSGYQAAVLATIAREVYSVEIIPELADSAKRRLAGLGYDNVHVRCGNGREGWPEHAPYDAIIVTAAADAVPSPLVDQLASGGVMVIPVNTSRFGQSLKRITRSEDGDIDETDVLPVVFVPLTGD